MKTLTAIIFLAFIVPYSNSQEGWFQLVSGTANYLNAVYFVSPSTGWVVGQVGTLLKTTNAGLNWFTQNPNSSDILYSIFFIDANTGWLVGQNGTTRKTTNGGSLWVTQVSGSSADYLYCVFFTDANTGYISGWAGLMLKTTNGGLNWIQLNTGTTHAINCIYFPPSSTSLTGFTCGGTAVNGEVLKTSNGGINWESQVIASYWLRGIHFPDLQTGWTVGLNGTMFSTSNSGLNWIERSSGTTNRFEAVVFPNSLTGYITGWFSTSIMKTTNGGVNWFIQTNPTANSLTCTFFTNEYIGWAAGLNGTILHTTNGGVTFISKISSEVPQEFRLYQNYPNPFNPTTSFKFSVPVDETVTLKIYNISGMEEATLVNERLGPGTYDMQWDAKNFPSGVYFYRLAAGDFAGTRKMVLIK